jgi:hypothetical protein
LILLLYYLGLVAAFATKKGCFGVAVTLTATVTTAATTAANTVVATATAVAVAAATILIVPNFKKLLSAYWSIYYSATSILDTFSQFNFIGYATALLTVHGESRHLIVFLRGSQGY